MYRYLEELSNFDEDDVFRGVGESGRCFPSGRIHVRVLQVFSLILLIESCWQPLSDYWYEDAPFM